MNIPTVDNPLFLIYQGGVPAMKNSTQINVSKAFIDEQGSLHQGKVNSVGRKKSVRQFLSNSTDTVEQQMRAQGFDTIPMPLRVASWVQVGFYLALKSKAVMTTHDSDNAYTTIQETWQKTIIDNDRQVVDYHVSQLLIRNKPALYSLAIVWSLDPMEAMSPNYCVESFIKIFNTYKDKRVWEILQRNRPVSPLQPKLHLKDKRL